ncbi:Clavaminate synthase-like protein [Trametes elegans]|nr:Clavaminate synthase-like protein [Trametes elegans]
MPVGLRAAFRSYVAELPNEYRATTSDTLACVRDGVDVLIDAARVLGDLALTRGDTRASLEGLLKHAHAGMSTRTAVDALGWRRVYTDACVLLAYDDVLDHWTSGDPINALSAIARLDHAIVIAGAAGGGRLDLVLDLIEAIQHECLNSPASRHSDLSSVPPARRDPTTSPRNLATASKAVPCLEKPPSLSSFTSRLSRHPFALRGFLKEWPALNEHPWNSLDYLRAVAGPGRVIPVEVGSDYRSDDWTQKMMPWEEFLDALEPSTSSTQPQPVLYLAQHSLLKQFPALQGDIIVPDYVYSALDPPDNYPQYAPPHNEEQLVLNAWLGPAGTVSPAHTDPFFNFYAQVVGQKTIWLAPPEVSAHMYPYPSKEATPNPVSDLAEGVLPRNPAANQESPSMSNTTRVDVFLGSDEEVSQSKAEFPDFWREAVPAAMSITLFPGDLLFFPPGWWHAMRSEEMSFSVSMWF